MNIIIDQYGVKIEVQDQLFKIGTKDLERKISPHKVSSINILKPASVTTPALILAAKYQIPFLIYNGIGKVEARVWSPYYGNIATIRKQQAFFTESEAAINYMAQILSTKLRTKLEVLTHLMHTRPSLKQEIGKIYSYIVTRLEAFEKVKTFEKLRSIEANVAKNYWQAVRLFIEHYSVFTKREHQKAKHPLNVSLNYGYGILYGVVESSILMAGLDPYMGIMHSNQYKQPVLAFDLIEPFRAWVDKMIINLFVKKQLIKEHFEVDAEGNTIINRNARKIIISHFFQMMDRRNYLKGKRIKNQDHIHYQSSQLVKLIKKQKIT